MKRLVISAVILCCIGCQSRVSREHAIPLLKGIYPEIRQDALYAVDPNALLGMDRAINSGIGYKIYTEWQPVYPAVLTGIGKQDLESSVQEMKVERANRFDAVVENLK